MCDTEHTPVIYYLVYLALKDTKDYYIIFLLNPSFSIHCLNGEISNICMRHFWSMHVVARGRDVLLNPNAHFFGLNFEFLNDAPN